MSDPFKIEGPAVISFSGGRTSGMMLRKILDAHGGTLPDDVRVIFTNTGKELPRTLDFVDEVSRRWSVEIIWLEYRSGRTFDRVTHATASRNGEPFTALIADRNYLPNPTQRLCTVHLKIDVVRRWVLRELKWKHWTSVVGFRADEPGRLGGQSPRWEVVAPLREAGIAKADVQSFWRAQPFDLGLKPWESNCDNCFLKSANKRVRIERDWPGSLDWWIDGEHTVKDKSGAFVPFRSHGPDYTELKRRASLPMLPLGDPLENDIDDLGDCVCEAGT